MLIDTNQFIKIKPCLFYSQLYDSSFYMKIHAHNTLEIMYVTKGVMDFISLIDNNEVINKVYQGQFVIIKSNIPHKIAFSDTKTHVLNIEFESYDNSKSINDLFLSNAYSNQYVKSKKLFKESKGPIILEDNGDVFQTINRIHRLLFSNVSIESFETQYSLIIGQFITDILNCSEQYYDNIKGNYFIKKALTFIYEKYKNSEIKVDDIASYVGCSKTYLEKLFLNEFNMSIAKKMNEIRIEKAKMYLRNLPMSPEEIAFAVGFSNYQSFINNFKDVTDLKPAMFSKNMSLQYNVIHAYEKSIFDMTYNKIMSSESRIGICNSSIKDALSNESINTFVLDNNIESIDNDTIKLIKYNYKSFFYNIEVIRKNIDKNININKSIIEKDLSDLFLGFYISHLENINELYAIIDNIHQAIPYVRIIIDLEGYEDTIKKKIVSETYVTDILDIEENFDVHYHKNVNKWKKVKVKSLNKLNTSNISNIRIYDGILYSLI